jgi:hypothetical protein
MWFTVPFGFPRFHKDKDTDHGQKAHFGCPLSVGGPIIIGDEEKASTHSDKVPLGPEVYRVLLILGYDGVWINMEKCSHANINEENTKAKDFRSGESHQGLPLLLLDSGFCLFPWEACYRDMGRSTSPVFRHVHSPTDQRQESVRTAIDEWRIEAQPHNRQGGAQFASKMVYGFIEKYATWRKMQW